MKPSRSVISFYLITGALLLTNIACGSSSTAEPYSPANKSAAANTSASPSATKTTAVETPKDISGDYNITGTNEGGGGAYKGTLKVTNRDDVFQFSWDAGKTYDGVGVMTDSAVAVSYMEGSNGDGCGVVLYKIGADGKLDGKAGYWGVNQAESETATRTSGSDLAGDYDAAGTNTKGEAYKSKLTVKAAGAGYTFSWDGGKLLGFGIKQGDKVAVGFGKPQCGFVAYEVGPDDTMNGKWGSVGATTVGTETAKKK